MAQDGASRGQPGSPTHNAQTATNFGCTMRNINQLCGIVSIRFGNQGELASSVMMVKVNSTS